MNSFTPLDSMPRVHLRPTGEDGSDYINASFVDVRRTILS